MLLRIRHPLCLPLLLLVLVLQLPLLMLVLLLPLMLVLLVLLLLLLLHLLLLLLPQVLLVLLLMVSVVATREHASLQVSIPMRLLPFIQLCKAVILASGVMGA